MLPEHLQTATTATSLLPGAVAGNGRAVLDPADLHSGTSKGAESALCTGSWGLGAVSTSGSQLDVQCGDAQGLTKLLSFRNIYRIGFIKV